MIVKIKGEKCNLFSANFWKLILKGKLPFLFKFLRNEEIPLKWNIYISWVQSIYVLRYIIYTIFVCTIVYEYIFALKSAPLRSKHILQTSILVSSVVHYVNKVNFIGCQDCTNIFSKNEVHLILKTMFQNFSLQKINKVLIWILTFFTNSINNSVKY